jgi:hypothetical protein
MENLKWSIAWLCWVAFAVWAGYSLTLGGILLLIAASTVIWAVIVIVGGRDLNIVALLLFVGLPVFCGVSGITFLLRWAFTLSGGKIFH